MYFFFHCNNDYAEDPQYYVYTYIACLVIYGILDHLNMFYDRLSYGIIIIIII